MFISKLGIYVHPRLNVKRSTAFKAQSMRSLESTEEGKRQTDALRKRCTASALQIAVVHNGSLITVPKQPKLQGQFF